MVEPWPGLQCCVLRQNILLFKGLSQPKWRGILPVMLHKLDMYAGRLSFYLFLTDITGAMITLYAKKMPTKCFNSDWVFVWYNYCSINCMIKSGVLESANNAAIHLINQCCCCCCSVLLFFLIQFSDMENNHKRLWELKLVAYTFPIQF